jgi:hypothetical protein
MELDEVKEVEEAKEVKEKSNPRPGWLGFANFTKSE